MDFHLAFEKRLGQRRALIGQGVLGGEENNLAVKPLLAQGRRGLNPGVAGADDDDRGQRHARDVEGLIDPAGSEDGAAVRALEHPSRRVAFGSAPQDEEADSPPGRSHSLA